MSGKSRVQQAMEAEAPVPFIQRHGLDPSKYSKAFDRRCHDYALLGADDTEIAGLLGVDPETFTRWVVEQPTLARQLSRARVDAPVRIVKSLHRAANGFKHRETKLNVIDGQVIKTDITRVYPPNVQAATLILTNRDGARWKDRRVSDTGLTLDLGAVITEVLSRRKPAPGDDAKTIEAQRIEPDKGE